MSENHDDSIITWYSGQHDPTKGIMQNMVVLAIARGAFYGIPKAQLHQLLTKTHHQYAPYHQLTRVYDEAVSTYGKYDPFLGNRPTVSLDITTGIGN